jgi:hypothetical protein
MRASGLMAKGMA